MTLPSGNDRAKDRRFFKTPFFKVEVAEPTGDYLELPAQISKLISQVEISEFIKTCNKNQLKLTIYEGSREPLPADGNATLDSLYEGGSLTNGPGFIPDLKVISTNGGLQGITSLALNAVRGVLQTAQNAANAAGAALDAIGLGGLFSASVEESSDLENINFANARFMFSPRNRLRVTWGYIEDPESQRVFAGHITIIRTNFPESGTPQTEIIAQGPTAEADQIVPTEGTRFENNSLLSQFAGALGSEVEPITVGAMLSTISDSTDFDVIKSDDLEDVKAAVWTSGQTLNQYLSEAAGDTNCYFTMMLNPTTSKPTIIFIKRTELQKRTMVPEELMTYRGPGSILKSVNITSNFSNISKFSEVGIGEDGTLRKTTGTGQEQQVLFQGNTAIDTDPSEGSNATTAGQSLRDLTSNSSATGYVEYNPAINVLGESQTRSSNIAANKAGCGVVLEFSTVGYPKISPGGCPFKGIGIRYSGFYSILQVSHIIDSNGYICRGAAKGANSGGEGVDIPDSNNQPLNQSTEAVQLYDNLTKNNPPSGGGSNGINISDLTASIDDLPGPNDIIPPQPITGTA